MPAEIVHHKRYACELTYALFRNTPDVSNKKHFENYCYALIIANSVNQVHAHEPGTRQSYLLEFTQGYYNMINN